LFTVTAVDISSKKIVFINKNTYPFMPVWVALVITSSLPTLFTPVKARSEWLQSFDLNSNERNLSLFFRDEQENTGPSTFVSGNLIASIPLDFLTSHKCNKLYFKLADCTFINFSLERKPFQQQAGITFNRHFFSAW
jgi:predicted acylesterase/phospholipase RssA